MIECPGPQPRTTSTCDVEHIYPWYSPGKQEGKMWLMVSESCSDWVVHGWHFALSLPLTQSHLLMWKWSVSRIYCT